MKWINWMAKIIVSALLISGISLYTTWFAVHSYMDQLLRKYNIPVNAQTLNLSDWANQLAAQLMAWSSRAGEARLNPSITPNPGSQDVAGGSPLTSSSSTAASEPEPTRASTPDAVAVWSQSGGSGGISSSGSSAGQQTNTENRVVLSAEEFYKKKELLSSEDKVKIFSILMARIPQEDLQSISTYVENGITSEEMKLIDEIIKKKLKPEEYEQLLQIMQKY